MNTKTGYSVQEYQHIVLTTRLGPCCKDPGVLTFALCAFALLTWYSLMVMPVTCEPLTAAMVRMGPPTPQPQSSVFMPGPRRSTAARRASWAASEALRSLPAQPWRLLQRQFRAKKKW